MPADELHRWILVGRLLPKDRTGEDAVIPMFLSDVDLDGQLVFGENMAHLRVLHGIDDTKEKQCGRRVSNRQTTERREYICRRVYGRARRRRRRKEERFFVGSNTCDNRSFSRR